MQKQWILRMASIPAFLLWASYTLLNLPCSSIVIEVVAASRYRS